MKDKESQKKIDQLKQMIHNVEVYDLVHEVFEANESHIGKEYYPIDNSWSQDLSNGKSVRSNNGSGLAGSCQRSGVKVKIIIPSIVLSFFDPMLREELTYNFSIVEYMSKRYLILNKFSMLQPLADDHYIDMDYE